MIAAAASDLTVDIADLNCERCILNTTVVNTNLVVPPNILSAPGAYVLQVQARSGTQYGPWSGRIAFNTQPQNPPTNYLLTVTSNGNGTIRGVPPGIDCGSVCTASFAIGYTVRLTATPNPGYTFAGWGGDCADFVSNDCQIVMDAARTVFANYSANYNLTVRNTNPQGGRIVSDLGGVDCGTTCTPNFPPGTSLYLTAIPNPGYSFAGWSGECSGYVTGQASTCSVQMSGDRTITAGFSASVPLTITVVPQGQGAIVSNPEGIDCGTTCTAVFAPNSTITLTAGPSSGYSLHDWGGDCDGATDETCIVTVTAARNATAHYVQNFPLTITNYNKAGGTVSSDTGGIDCGETCYARYRTGILVTLSAIPAPGYRFVGWSGDCSSGSTTCTRPVIGPTNVFANFESITASSFPLNVYNANRGGGSVTSNIGGIACGGVCTHDYPAGSVVVLSVNPGSGFRFGAWGGDCAASTAPSCTLSMAASRNVTATFLAAQAPTYTITDLGTLDALNSAYSYASGINSNGLVVGWSRFTSPGGSQDSHGFLYDSGGMHDLGTLGARAWSSSAMSISDIGWIVGYGTTPGDVTTHAFLSDGDGMRDLGTLDDPNGNIAGKYSYARNIDAGGRIVGYSTIASGSAFHGFYLSGNGVMRDIGTLGGTNSYANALNARGQIVGTSDIAGDTAFHAFVYDVSLGTRLDLGTLGGNSSVARSINNDSRIVGRSFTALNLAEHAFLLDLYSAAGMQDLGTLGGNYSVATSVNGIGQIVGSSNLVSDGGQYHAFLYDEQGIHDLNSLLRNNANGWVLAEAMGINDKGQIIANSAGFSAHAFLLTPITIYPLTATVTGGGDIASDPDGISCGSECSAAFPEGQVVSLRANPALGSSFIGWSGDCAGSAGDVCVLTLDSAKNATANFGINYSLTIENVNGVGGTVTTDKGGIDCGMNCSQAYASGSIVRIFANPAAGFRFSGWGGDCSGSLGTTCELMVDSARLVTADFSPNFALTVTNENRSGGVVATGGQEISCGDLCSTIYFYPTDVVLSATSADGYLFAGWTGDCQDSGGGGVCRITVNGNKSVGANFLRLKGSQTIIFGAPPLLMTGERGTVSATGGASGNPVVFSTQTSSVCVTGGTNGSLVTGIAEGTCTIAANQSGNENFEAAPEISQSFSVYDSCQTGALTVGPVTYGAGTLTLAAGQGLTTQGAVQLLSGADVTFRAPLLRFGNGFRVAAGARFQARAEAVTCSAVAATQAPNATAPTPVPAAKARVEAAPATVAPLPFPAADALPPWVQDALAANGVDRQAIAQALLDPQGQWLLLETTQGLDPADTNATSDIYRQDLLTGRLTLLSHTPQGTAGHGPSRHAAADALGDWVVFQSDADDLVTDDDNGVSDIFLYEVPFGTLRRVTATAAGASAHPALDAAGQDLLYDQQDDGGRRQVLADRLWGGDGTEPVGPTTEGADRLVDSHHPAISADGRYVAYLETPAMVARPGDQSDCQVHVYDRGRGRDQRLACPDPLAAASETARPHFSDDGTQLEWFLAGEAVPVAVANPLMEVSAGPVR